MTSTPPMPAQADNRESPNGGSRRHDLDALRAFAMLLGIALHAALSFVRFPWMVQDTRQHDGFGLLFLAVHGFRMPLFFLLSGFFTAMLWRRRGLRSLLGQRFRRIVLPLGLCMVTIVPATSVVSGMAIMSASKSAARGDSAARSAGPDADIWAAAQRGDAEAVAAQLDGGADVDGRHPDSGSTPLVIAALFDQTDVVDLLLRRGADVDARGGDGGTALHAAAFLGHYGSARLLIAAGADTETRNATGATPGEALLATWEVTEYIAGLLQMQLDKEKVLAGRKEVAALLAEQAGPASDGSVPPTASAPRRPGRWRGLAQWLTGPSVFHHLWFLWFLCWLVPGFAAYAVVADRLGWRGAPSWLAVSPLRLLWLIPLTTAAQWHMAQTFGAFGPDTSSGLLPMPAVLAYYAIFFGFGALYYDARDDDGRLGRWWWLSLPAALLVALPLGLAFAMGEVEALGKIATPGPRRAIGSALQVTYAWLMTFGLMGLCRAAFSEERAWLRYVSDSSYWLYIAHLPLIIWGQMIVRDWPAPAFVKFTLVCGIVSGVLLLSYHTVVRYTPLGTLLNGPRTRPRRASRSSA